jgi:hypothetical protein
MTTQRFFGPVMAFGLLIGGSFIATSLLFIAAGREVVLNPRLGNVLSCLLIIGSFIGIKKLRDDRLQGIITYGRAFATGFKIILVATVLYAVYTFILYSALPGLVEEYRVLITAMFQQVYGDTPLRALMEEVFANALSPAFIAVEELIGKVLSGSFFILIVAAILRRAAVPTPNA